MRGSVVSAQRRDESDAMGGMLMSQCSGGALRRRGSRGDSRPRPVHLVAARRGHGSSSRLLSSSSTTRHLRQDRKDMGEILCMTPPALVNRKQKGPNSVASESDFGQILVVVLSVFGGCGFRCVYCSAACSVRGACGVLRRTSHRRPWNVAPLPYGRWFAHGISSG